MAKETVCVTGANGFIGSWVVRTLLEKGYTTIHASIFPGSDPTHLLQLPVSRAEPRVEIKIYEANLLDCDAVSRAIEGCAGVFHLATPCTIEPTKDPEKELIEPAVKGTVNVLEAAKRFKVRRVVITSSVATVVPNPNWPSQKPLDESSWTDVEYSKSIEKWYGVSKTLAEKEAWEFSHKQGTDIVTVHPSICLGPMLQPGLNASCGHFLKFLRGSTDILTNPWVGAVHVQDVAKAQVMLFETPEASGRYICTNGTYHFDEFVDRICELFPEFPIRRYTGETKPDGPPHKDAAKRLMELGLVFTPVEDAVRDTIESLKSKGFL